eukprot:Gregarina_sp_Poly_1__4203@NODE_229_length_11141_cov_173_244537_g203_i0_p1_GENE_NODE_229_length_11141_cov_173_244537_g203_i0NODE_229_length_11141_cov_173_244537_g203_i0_p1_ORF_typecomplete_len916_score120_46_NODE_229_length_11141_cov_173_244537_g203_i026555402
MYGETDRLPAATSLRKVDSDNRRPTACVKTQLLRSGLGSLSVLCCETLNLILSYLDPVEVCLRIKPLCRDLDFFVERLWIPTSLRLNPTWVDRFATECASLRNRHLSPRPIPETASPNLETASLIPFQRPLAPTSHCLHEVELLSPGDGVSVDCHRVIGLTGGITGAKETHKFRSNSRRKTISLGPSCELDSNQEPNSNRELGFGVIVPVCLHPRVAFDAENKSPAALIPLGGERSALSLLRALAQDTFLFLFLTDAPESLPSWFRRCQTQLQHFSYLQSPALSKKLGRPGSEESARLIGHGGAGDLSYPTTPRQPYSSMTPVSLQVDHPNLERSLANDNLSLLDVMLLLFGSFRTIKSFALETTAHFSSFLQGPAIPRCPISLSRRKRPDSLPSSFCLLNQTTAAEDSATAFPVGSLEDIHWDCWDTLLNKVLPIRSTPFDLTSLQHLSISGSYLPATLAVLAALPSLRFSNLRRLCIKGALAVGRCGLEALEMGAIEGLGSQLDVRQVCHQPWWIRDMMGCLLFAANPFRGMSASARVGEESLRRRYWTTVLPRLFACDKFPALETLELRIGCGPLERRIWWCLLLTEIFQSDTLRFLEFDCTIESLTCFLPGREDAEEATLRLPPCTPRRTARPVWDSSETGFSPISRDAGDSVYTTPRHSPTSLATPLRHHRQSSGDLACGHRLSLGLTLFADASRFPALEVIRVASAYSLSDVLRFEEFIGQRMLNQGVVVQVRRLHLFVRAQDFPEQCELLCEWTMNPKHQCGLFAPNSEPLLVLDFSFSFPAAVKQRKPRQLSDRSRSHHEMIPGVRRLVISRFNPLCAYHLAILAAVRFPSSCIEGSTTSLTSVSIRMGLPENLVYYNTKMSPPTWETPASLKLARETLWTALKAHPDISQVQDIQVVPSPCWLRGS